MWGKRFHYTWLRDNCLNSKSRHPDSLEKLDDLTQHPFPPEPKSVEQKDDNLIIEWNENPPHRSVFPISWLLTHACDPQPKPLTQAQTILWDKASLEANPVPWHDLHQADPQVWMSQLLSLGFVILRNISLE